ncbi:hypothetical protein LTR84_008231 [Exophiala bonariae]|uniref:Transcription factor domain-containing protein n=1 Tax=Exophiala bonariae TaxID=1690606 RepID=A0AAV9MZP1_9EURO|nr:hypothetical protein LTR84_008231 [Exophiala bonariae]
MPTEDKSTIRRTQSNESLGHPRNSTSHLSPAPGFVNNPDLSTRSPDPGKLKASELDDGPYTGKSQSLDYHERVPATESLFGTGKGIAGVVSTRLGSTRTDLPTRPDNGRNILHERRTNALDGQLLADSKSRQDGSRIESEFGLLSLEGSHNVTTPPPEWGSLETASSEVIKARTMRASKLLAGLENSVERIPIHLLPSDRNLVRYFAVNAGSFLGLDRFPEIEEKFDPVYNFIFPFASSSQWCFETIVLLGSAYHHHKHVHPGEDDTFDSENHYLAARQNVILAQTRSRISALTSRCDSTDFDVVAFLFLALGEYCYGDREIGRMHFHAWTDYCEMRRKFNAPPCGLPCKIVVWWCVSMLVEDDVTLDSIIDSPTKTRVRKDPAKLFRYFMSTTGVDLTKTSTESQVRRLDRRLTN